MLEKRPITPDPMLLGKIPPQCVDLEEGVLGGILLEGIDDRIDFLKSEHFYKDSHQKIFEAITELNKNHEIVDMLTVVQKLRSMGELEVAGGPHYISQLTTRIGSSENIEEYGRIIVQQYLKRAAIRISSEIIQNGYDDTTDPFDIVAEGQKEFENLFTDNIQMPGRSAHQIFIESIQRDRKIAQLIAEGKTTGIPSGLPSLDRITGGWQDTDLIILAGRPGMGKTSLMQTLCTNPVNIGIPVGMFSLEMNDYQIMQRIKSARYNIPLNRLLRAGLTDYEIEQMVKDPFDKKLIIDDQPGLTADTFRGKARKMVTKHGVKLIVVDYLQLMHGSKDNREQEINQVTTVLKETAKTLNIPIIALAQLSRAVESRADKIPQLSDLRESGSIEQTADLIAFLWRPEYYGNTHTEEGDSLEGLAKVFIAKHRNGALALGDHGVNLKFEGDFTRFSDFYPATVAGEEPKMPF